MELGLLIFASLYVLIPWVASSEFNRSFLGWFILTLILSPIITFLILAVIGNKKDPNEALINEIRELKKDKEDS